MPVPVIVGNAASTATRRVLVVAYHYGLVEGQDFLFQSVDMDARYDPGWPHPFKQVPYLQDGDMMLYESRAMSKYLLARNGLYPTDPVKIALFEQACSVEASNFDVAGVGIAVEKVVKKNKGLEPDERLVAAYVDTFTRRMPGYESILSRTKYLAGNELTAADLFHLPYGQLASSLGLLRQITDTERFPSVCRWWTEISSLPAWRQANEKIPK